MYPSLTRLWTLALSLRRTRVTPTCRKADEVEEDDGDTLASHPNTAFAVKHVGHESPDVVVNPSADGGEKAAGGDIKSSSHLPRPSSHLPRPSSLLLSPSTCASKPSAHTLPCSPPTSLWPEGVGVRVRLRLRVRVRAGFAVQLCGRSHVLLLAPSEHTKGRAILMLREFGPALGACIGGLEGEAGGLWAYGHGGLVTEA